METRTILFVDDEERILSSLKRGLMDEPYNLLFADSGKKALEILSKNQVHIVVTDMKMPEMDGLALLKIVKEKYPLIVRLVLSGYTQVNVLLTAINQGEIFKFITKPWQLDDELKGILVQAVDYYNLRAERDRLAKELEAMKLANASVK
jgi:DNA-binding NtrC family response regulator